MGEIKKAYIAELEQRLNDGRNELQELELRMQKANVETGHQLYVQIYALREQCDDTRALLQTLRESSHTDWKALKEEIEKAWLALRGGLDNMARGLAQQWDERDP